MANQLLVNPYPMGIDHTLNSYVVNGSIVLAGSAVSTGEPITWNNMITGIGYNETNFVGVGNSLNAPGVVWNNDSALVTALSASAGTVTATANNNFYVGQKVKFVGCTTALGLLLNGVIVTVVTASSTQFTFLSGATGSGSSEVGMAIGQDGPIILPESPTGPNMTASVTAVSASSGIITVTAANKFLPGASVVFSNPSAGTLVTALANSGITYAVLSSTGSAFTIASSLTGTTGTATAIGFNCQQPYMTDFWSANDSGYVYSYSEATGVLFVQTGGAAVSSPMANLAAGAYPANVLGDIIKYQAWFQKA